MNDDLTPPPERPMPQASRARVRADLMAAAGRRGHGPGGQGSWAVPVAAAAGLLAVVAATGFALTRVGDDGSSDGAPAVSTSQTPTATEMPSPSSDVATQSPSPSSSQTEAPRADPCGQELRPVLRGAALRATFEDPDGTVGFYVAGDRYALCDDSGGRVTVHAPHAVDPPPSSTDVATYRVSSGIISAAHRTYVTRFVAGGVLPADLQSVRYTFPDGHRSDADLVRKGGTTWWRMVYVARDGVITDPGTNQLDLEPITVHVTGPGGSHDLSLRWALDTCAQVNHGC